MNFHFHHPSSLIPHPALAIRCVMMGLAVFGILVASSQPAHAIETRTDYQGMAVTPFLIDHTAQKGDVFEEKIRVQNVGRTNARLDVTTSDFAPQGTEGQVMVPVSDDLVDARYSLSEWVEVVDIAVVGEEFLGTTDSLLAAKGEQGIIKPGQAVEVTVRITVPKDAEDGTHYGLVLFSLNEGELSKTGSKISQKVGTMLLLKIGRPIEKGQLSALSTDREVYEEPMVTFNAEFENAGNVHVRPKGTVTVTNLFGQEVGEVTVNRDALSVLPETTRTFEVPWEGQRLLGWYKAEAVMKYGDAKLETRSVTYFWVLPWKTMVAVGAVLAAAVAGLWFGIRRYNRWLIARTINK